ncbi:MAG: PAS domain-containing protein, partial [Thermoactinomyces sp.]
MNKEDQPIFDFAIRTADVLVNMFGKHCEVAVHDFSNLKQSLIHLAGSVTAREIGSPATDLILNQLAKKQDGIKDLCNYQTQSQNGNILKSSTVFLRNKNNKVIGALCINYD